MNRVCAANRLLACFGQSEVANFSGADEVRHGAHHILDRHAWVDAMLIQQVDAIGLQPSERRLDDVANVRWPAVGPGDDTLLVELETELGRDDHAITAAI